ncbi:NAD-binding protein [Edaphobacillus lindanitolerans]|uniref:Dipicolinate synthase subunit A n=1 Tax=Edaphobacillus lindanitolerans TaxID=550447 RepID=A0A1U7PKV5_9BACI|nr:NAD-binding protein [Edaphobacillus lindanitolerans]SIT67201.1 dipicolinate synthase subunit A [Edaphobacillus lindanitolerans]
MSRAEWLLVGSDPRIAFAAERLKERGGPVVVHASDRWDAEADRLLSESRPSRLVLPMRPPAGLPDPDIISQVDAVFAGQLDAEWKEVLATAGAEPLFYLAEEQFVWENAGLTAEGFLASWYAAGRGSVRGREFYIAGYGRVGKTLARLLGSAGARITVIARSPAAIAEAGQEGFGICRVSPGMPPVGPETLINTIPARWLDPEGPVRPALLLDLASSPGCLAPGRRHEYYELLPALPGKWFPHDAARLLAEALSRIDGERKGRNDA